MILVSAIACNRNGDTSRASGHAGAVAPRTPLIRRFSTRREMDAFLHARDFRKLRKGWSNGDWFATAQPADGGILLALRLAG